MSQEFVIAHDVETGKPVKTSVKSLIASRALITGDSGSGKSHNVTTLIEKTSDSNVQRVILDIEGEYFPLKENFQFLLVGRSTDNVKPDIEVNLNDVYIEKLAQKIIDKSADCIIDLSEIPNDATHFIAVFGKALLRYAKLMKRPLLLFADEAHVYCPEKGTGREESLKVMIEIAKRGRKRGIGLICATQAVADFNKNIVRQLRTRFIGNTTYDNDIKAVCDYLGFGKERQPELRELAEEHHFFVIGPAVTVGGKKPKGVLRVKFEANETKLYDFDFTKRSKIQEKAPNAIKALVAEFSDIPQTIDAELDETEKLRKEVIDLRKDKAELQVKVSSQRTVDPSTLSQAEARGFEKGWHQCKREFDEVIGKWNTYIKAIVPRVEQIHKLSMIGDCISPSMELPKFNPKNAPALGVTSTITSIARPYSYSKPSSNSGSDKPDSKLDDSKLRDGAMRMLKFAAMYYPNPVTKIRVATLSGFSASGGTFNTYLSDLKKAGWITIQPDTITVTVEGMAAAGTVESIPADPTSILNLWKPKFRDGAAKMLEFVFNRGRCTVDELAEATGFAANGGTFQTYLSDLRKNDLVTKNGDMIEISRELLA